MGICLSCRRRKRRGPEKRKVGRPPCRGAQPLYAFAGPAGREPSRPSPPPPTLTLLDLDGSCDLIQFTRSDREDVAVANMANTISNLTKNPLKEIVSKKKIRFTEDGFNLDLAYITHNIIAMGFPAERLEGYYRNHIDDVYKFLEHKHKDHYRIYNLCSERTYTYAKFSDKVVKFPFDDHNPPKLELIQTFCEDVAEWLSKSGQNVAAIHCKAGKGRTGTMVCCYLLHCAKFNTAKDALHLYGEKRTRDSKGVTIPSQRRYVEYYAKLRKDRVDYRPEALKLHCLRMRPVTTFSSAHLVLEICVHSASEHNSNNPFKTQSVNKVIDHLEVDLEGKVFAGDVRVEVCSKPKVIMGKDRLCHFWFNTFFVIRGLHSEPIPSDDGSGQTKYRMTLDKMDLDDAHKDKQHKIFPADFQVELIVQRVPLNMTAEQPAPARHVSHQHTNANTHHTPHTPQTASPSNTDSSSDDSGGQWEDYFPEATADNSRSCPGSMQGDCQSRSDMSSTEFAAGGGECCAGVKESSIIDCISGGSQDHLIPTDDWSIDATVHDVRLRSHSSTDGSFHQCSYKRHTIEKHNVSSADETSTVHSLNFSNYGELYEKSVTRNSMSRTVNYQTSRSAEETAECVDPQQREWAASETVARPRLSLGDVRATWRDFSEKHFGTDAKHKKSAKTNHARD